MKQTVYKIEITIDHAKLTTHAAAVVPKAIKRMARELKVKMALVSGDTAVPMSCRVEDYTGQSYDERSLDLTEDDDDDATRQEVR